MSDIFETIVAVKAKFGTSSSNIRKVLKALLMEQMAHEEDSRKEKATREPKKADVKSSTGSSPSGEISPVK